ncbi:MAG: hypothetical protein F6K65_41900 [Moorea sp. SIO3C2]|nr:hypothetical protein [Moorena sp. SIO3C2]
MALPTNRKLIVKLIVGWAVLPRNFLACSQLNRHCPPTVKYNKINRKVGSNHTNSKAYHQDDNYCPPYLYYSLFPLLKVGSNNTNFKAYHQDDNYCPPYISLFPIPFASNPQLAFSCNWCI